MTSLIRYSLGTFLVVMGLNKFITLFPPGEFSLDAARFIQALQATGYMFKMVGTVEITSGLMLFSKKTTPLAIVLLAPLSVNLILFHIFLDPSTIFFASIVCLVNIYLAIKYFDFYRPIFAKLLQERVTIENNLIEEGSPIAEVS